MNTRFNGRGNKRTMSTKRASRSTTPTKEPGKVEKTPKKCQNDGDKIYASKHLAVEENVEKESDNENQQNNSKVPYKESMNGDKPPAEVGNKEESDEKFENGTDGDTKAEESAKHNGTNSRDVHSSESTQQGCTKANGNKENESGEPSKETIDEIFFENAKDKTDELMEEPMLTLSEDEEKLSLHDSFDVECAFDTASNVSSIRLQVETTLEAPKIIIDTIKESVVAKATTSNDNNCILVDESDDANTDTESTSTTTLDQKVSSTEVVRDAGQQVNASLIANYSGNTTLDLSMETSNNTNNSNFSDSLNLTTESQSYSRSLRSISGRKSLRPLREISFRNSKRLADASSYRKDDTQSSTNVTVNTELNTSLGSKMNKSLKRERSMTPNHQEDSKRIKTEASTAEFIKQFIPSPMTALRRRFYSSKISSSTPKKMVETANETDDEITEKRLQVYTGNEAKKNWCVIM